MVTISRSNSLDSMATTTDENSSSHPLPKTAGPVNDSGRRQRSFTTMLRSLASKFTSSQYSVPTAMVDDAEGGPAPMQGPITWEEAMESVFVKTVVKVIDDYDDDGDLPPELIALIDMRPANEMKEKNEVIRGLTQLRLRPNERGAFLGEWVEL